MAAGVRILVVEDEEGEREAMSRLLRSARYDVITAANLDEAKRYGTETVDLVITSLSAAHRFGRELQKYWRKRQAIAPIIVVAERHDVLSAVESLERVANDHLSRPNSEDDLVPLANGCLVPLKPADKSADLRRRLSETGGFERIVGLSKAICEVRERARRAAASHSTVLITGEAGTGRTLIAETIHRNSDRRHRPFVTVNVASIPARSITCELFGHAPGAFEGALEPLRGRFELASSGTIFIDEVSELSREIQARLLCLLEKHTVTPVGAERERAVDVRVIAATGEDLERRVAAGTFREDLYYRLGVVTLYLPPLRERPEDIPLLMSHFMQQLSEARQTSLHLDEPLRDFLQTYCWPGNVRQLHSCLADMVALANSDTLTVNDVPLNVRRDARLLRQASVPTNTRLDDVERMAVMQALRVHDGNRTHAAKTLGISVRTLQRRLRAWSVEQPSEEMPWPKSH